MDGDGAAPQQNAPRAGRRAKREGDADAGARDATTTELELENIPSVGSPTGGSPQQDEAEQPGQLNNEGSVSTEGRSGRRRKQQADGEVNGASGAPTPSTSHGGLGSSVFEQEYGTQDELQVAVADAPAFRSHMPKLSELGAVKALPKVKDEIDLTPLTAVLTTPLDEDGEWQYDALFTQLVSDLYAEVEAKEAAGGGAQLKGEDSGTLLPSRQRGGPAGAGASASVSSPGGTESVGNFTSTTNAADAIPELGK